MKLTTEMPRPFAPAVYLVTDRALCGARSVTSVVQLAVAGGAGAVQLRDPRASTRELVEQARALMSALAGTGIPLLINDRVDVALAVGAHGVHIGQSDLSPADARRLLGPEPLLGLSITCEEELREADLALVDYLGVGPVFATATKLDAAPALGTAGLRSIAQRTTVPIVAIGGVNAKNAPLVVAAGARGIAVVSAICCADDPAEATRALVASVR